MNANERRTDLERSASSEARINIMPPFEFVAFAELPAKQHDATVTE